MRCNLASLGLIFTTISLLTLGSVCAQSISGRLFDEDSNPLQEPILVQCSRDHDFWLEVTTENSYYEFSNLEPGNYYARAMSAAGGWYYRKYWPGSWTEDDAELLNIWDRENWTDMDFYLQPGGKLTGSIIPAEGGEFNPRSVSFAVFQSGNNLYIYESFWEFRPENPGNYITIPLPPGEYVALVQPAPPDLHVQTFYGNSFRSNDAVPISVDAWELAEGIDFEPELGGAVTGVVTGGGELLPYSHAYCLVDDGSYIWTYLPYTYGVCNEEGVYTVYGIPEGSCFLNFRPSAPEFLPEFWQNAYDIRDASPVRVHAGRITENINPDLNYGGSLSGEVSDPDGNILKSADWGIVELIPSLRSLLPVDIILEDGSWHTTDPVAPGIYTLRLNPQNNESIWRTTYLGGSFLPWEAQWFRLVLGEEKEPISLQYQTGGGIEVTLLSPQGEPVPYVNFNIWLENQKFDDFSVHTVDPGLFLVYGLEPGDYTLEAYIDPEMYQPGPEMRDQPPDPDHLWPALYSGNQTSLNSAEAIPVQAGDISQIEMQFMNGGVVHILVTAPEGAGLNLLEDDVTAVVLPLRSDGVIFYNAPSTTEEGPFVSEDGAYTILAPGEYTLLTAPVFADLHANVEPPSLSRTFLGNVADPEEASTFTIRAGETVEATVDLLVSGYTVSGRIDCELDLMPSNATLLLLQRSLLPVAAFSHLTIANEEGLYSMRGVADGEYFVFAMPEEENGFILNTWRPDIASPGVSIENLELPPDAVGVHVEGADVSDVNITLQRASDFRGVPLDDNPELPEVFILHEPYPNPFNDRTSISFTLLKPTRVKVELFDIQGRSVMTAANRRFAAGTKFVSIDGSALAAGTYIVKVSTPKDSQSRKLALLR